MFSCSLVQKLCHYLLLSEIIASVENPACYLVGTERWVIFSVDNPQIGLLEFRQDWPFPWGVGLCLENEMSQLLHFIEFVGFFLLLSS